MPPDRTACKRQKDRQIEVVETENTDKERRKITGHLTGRSQGIEKLTKKMSGRKKIDRKEPKDRKTDTKEDSWQKICQKEA